jgi:hypothetical protein
MAKIINTIIEDLSYTLKSGKRVVLENTVNNVKLVTEVTEEEWQEFATALKASIKVIK